MMSQALFNRKKFRHFCFLVVSVFVLLGCKKDKENGGQAPLPNPQEVLSIQAQEGFLSIVEGTALEAELPLKNVSQPDRRNLKNVIFSIIVPPTLGSIELLNREKGTYRYSVKKYVSGSDYFVFSVKNGDWVTSGRITIKVEEALHSPVANSVSLSLDEDTSIPIALSASDPEGDSLLFSIVKAPLHGKLVGTVPNVVYTPNANFNGKDSFLFRVTDSTARESSVTMVSIDVKAVNDGPVSQSQSVSTQEDTSNAIVLTGSDLDGDSLTYLVVNGPVQGVLSGVAPNLVYTPAADFNGRDSFSYKVIDSAGVESNVSVISIDVVAVDDYPVAYDDAIVMDEDRSAHFVLKAVEVDGEALSYTVLGLPKHGVVSGTPPNLNYIPHSDFYGEDSMDFRVTDTHGKSSFRATVSFKINPKKQLKVLKVEAGGKHACALLENHRLKCWGSNLFGQLGVGDTNNRGENSNEMGASLGFVDLGLGRTVTDFSLGSAHTCAILDNGALKCWGYNGHFQLGLDLYNGVGGAPNQMGDNLPAVSLGLGKLVKAVSAGEDHTCAILDNDLVKCWGSNFYGQLGLEEKQYAWSYPTREMGDLLPYVNLGSGRTALAVRAAYRSTCALLDNHEVKCWGWNRYGQLGLGDTKDRGENVGDMGDNLSSVNLGTGARSIGISLQSKTSCSLLDTLQLKCWGYNNFTPDHPQIYDSADQPEYAAMDTPNEMGDHLPYVDFGSGFKVQSISSNKETSCVILSNNKIKCWGTNSYGQLGLGDRSYRGDEGYELGDELPFVDLGSLRTAKSIAVGGSFSCAILDNDQVKCWGYRTRCWSHENCTASEPTFVGVDDLNNLGDNTDEMGDSLPYVDLGSYE